MRSVLNTSPARSGGAGLLIGLGCYAYCNMGGGVSASAVFSVGLLACLVLGLQLYTGKVGYWRSNGGFSPAALFVMLWHNLMLISPVAIWFALENDGNKAMDFAVSAARGNISETAFEWALFVFRSLMCGCLMHVASSSYKKSENKAVGAMVTVLSVMAFLNCGFEHCVANAFYFVAAYCSSSPFAPWYDALLSTLVCAVCNGIGARYTEYASNYIDFKQIENED